MTSLPAVVVYYLDASALVKRYTTETGSGWVQNLCQQAEEHQRLIGYDVFCANHRIGTMPSEQVVKSLKLFGEEVIPAFA